MGHRRSSSRPRAGVSRTCRRAGNRSGCTRPERTSTSPSARRALRPRGRSARSCRPSRCTRAHLHSTCRSPSRRRAERVPATSGKWVARATAGARRPRGGRIGRRCDRRSDPGEATVRSLETRSVRRSRTGRGDSPKRSELGVEPGGERSESGRGASRDSEACRREGTARGTSDGPGEATAEP